MNAELQRLQRRDKKAFLSDQCKEIEEINRMGKTRDLFKKIRDTKGIFYAKNRAYNCIIKLRAFQKTLKEIKPVNLKGSEP